LYTVRRRHRLKSNDRFRQVRRQGKSCKERRIILLYLENDLPYSRFGFTASRRVGNAVKRNRARRLMRESVRLQFETIATGWDMVFIARPFILGSSFSEVDADCRRALDRAGLRQQPAPVTGFDLTETLPS
jgi:ribonuclease P protein component